MSQDLISTERVGFEPTEGFPSNDFESFAFDHSATSPNCLVTNWAGLPLAEGLIRLSWLVSAAVAGGTMGKTTPH